MVPWFGVSAECQSIGTIEHNASPYWQENGWPLNKDGSCCISSTSCQSIGTFMSLGGPRHGARVWCLGECQSIGTSGKKQRACYLAQKLSVGPYFEPLFLGCGFLIHLSNRSGTVFIQGPSIVLLVWRSIMFNGPFLRVCRILQFVKKIRFCLLESRRTKPWSRVWCLGRVPKHRNQWQEVEGLLFSPKTLSWSIF